MGNHFKKCFCIIVSIACLAISFCMLCGCVQVSGGNAAEEGESGQAEQSEGALQNEQKPAGQSAAEETTGEVEEIQEPNQTEAEVFTGDAELDALLNDIVSNASASISALAAQQQEFLTAANDSYDGYQSNKQMLADWYASALSESEKLYSSMLESCAKYYEVLRSNDGYAEYKEWNNALDESYGVWNDSMSDYYREWNDLFEDVYKDCSDMITEASAEAGYNETSDAWDEMYDLYSDSWEDMYDLYSDSWEALYDAHNDIWEEMYDRS